MDGQVERLNQTSKVIFTEKNCHDLNALIVGPRNDGVSYHTSSVNREIHILLAL